MADEKTEADVIRNRRKKNTVQMDIGRRTMVSKSTIKYQGVFEAKLNFGAYKVGLLKGRVQNNLRLLIALVVRSI